MSRIIQTFALALSIADALPIAPVTTSTSGRPLGDGEIVATPGRRLGEDSAAPLMATNDECYRNDGQSIDDYNGKRNTGLSGSRCHSWKDRDSVEKYWDQLEGNYCRNPDNTLPGNGDKDKEWKGRGPWCYTWMDDGWTNYSFPGAQGWWWEFCGVPQCSPSPPPAPPPPPTPPRSFKELDCTQPFGFSTYEDQFTATPIKWVYNEHSIHPNLDKAQTLWQDKCGDTFWTEHAPTYNWNQLDAFEPNVVSCIGQMCLPGPGKPTDADNFTASQAVCSKEACSETDFYGCTFHLDRYAPMLVSLSQRHAASILSNGTRLSSDASSQLKHLRLSVKHFLDSLRKKPTASCATPLKADLLQTTRTVTGSAPAANLSECCDFCEHDKECNAWVYNPEESRCYLLASFGDVNYQMPDGLRWTGCSSKAINCTIGATGGSRKSGSPLVEAQMSALATMAATVARLPKAGFVPTFTRAIYEKRLSTYMNAFEHSMTTLDKHIHDGRALSLFSADLKTKQVQLWGEESVTAETQKQTQHSIQNALRGMAAASTGMKVTGKLMTASVDRLRAALDEWKWDQLISLGLDLITTIASVVELDFKDFGKGFTALKEEIWVLNSGKKAWDALGEIGKTLSTLGKVGSTVLNVFAALINTGKHLSEFDLDGEIALQLAKEIEESSALSNDLKQWAQSPNSTHSGDVVEVLTQAMNQLNEELPGMGNGAWDQYVVNAKKTFAGFLTGYNADVNAAAEEYISHLKSQAQYGNDFTTQGVRYVAAVQQYIINLAQMKANDNTQRAINDEYKVTGELEKYDMMQESILSIQVTSLALQMQTTMHQLCESYRYQTTRLYDECVGSNDQNVLNKVCGKFVDGEPAFELLLITPCKETSITLAGKSQKYLQKWEGMYANAQTVNNYMRTAIWGKDAHATDSAFVQLKVEVYEPPPCSNGFWETKLSLCNESMGEIHPNITFTDGTECLADNATMPKDSICCRIISWNANCTFDPPKDRPYITRDAFERFTDNTNEDWGKLPLSLQTLSRAEPGLRKYDEIFIRGVAAYFEGAEIDAPKAGGNLVVRLTSKGQMITRIKNRHWTEDDACKSAKRIDASTLCMFDNHTFIGAPSGKQATVSYTSNYHSPEANHACNGLKPKPVFYDKRTLAPKQFEWCTSLDFSSLESGNTEALYKDTNSPYNFASLYSSFELQVYSQDGGSDSQVFERSAGINLAKVQAIHLGMWLNTNGLNDGSEQSQDTCKDIEHKDWSTSRVGSPREHESDLFAQAGPFLDVGKNKEGNRLVASIPSFAIGY